MTALRLIESLISTAKRREQDLAGDIIRLDTQVDETRQHRIALEELRDAMKAEAKVES